MPLQPTSAISGNHSPQVQIAIQFIRSICDADFDTLRSTVTDDYIHTILPTTLQRPLLKGREAFVEHYQQTLGYKRIMTFHRE